MDRFRGRSFHTFHWPHEGVELEGKRVGIIGTGATAIQVIAEIADKVGSSMCSSGDPTGALRSTTARSPRRRWRGSARATTRSSRGATQHPAASSTSPTVVASGRSTAKSGWSSGTASTRSPVSASGSRTSAKNFTDEAANAEFSEYIAERIGKRVPDPRTAKTLIPRDHGFGVIRSGAAGISSPDEQVYLRQMN
jgi:cyclohexanone monooxygenase